VIEYFDEQIDPIGPLKHLVAAAACWVVLRYFQARQPIA
jgi:hypothetical protein